MRGMIDLVNSRVAAHTAEQSNAPQTASVPVIIECLGGFRLWVNGSEIETAPSRLTRPIELLLRVIAAGGAGLAVERATTEFWPLAASARARQSLDTTLARLKRTCGGNTILLRHGDALRINVDAARVDSLELEALFESLLMPLQPPLNGHDRDAAANRIRELCKGRFLPELRELPWAALTRNRIEDKRVRALRRLGIP